MRGAAGAEKSPVSGRLNAVYERAGLPPAQSPEQWAGGERRAQAGAEATAFARQAHAQPRRKPRAKKAAAAK